MVKLKYIHIRVTQRIFNLLKLAGERNKSGYSSYVRTAIVRRLRTDEKMQDELNERGFK